MASPEIVEHLAATPTTGYSRDSMPMEQQIACLKTTTTLYVGNLSFYTTEEQIYDLFSRAGEVRRIIMGLNRLTRTPCGFCFVECYSRADAACCIKYLHGAMLDGRPIRIVFDRGYEDGRQYGRGRSGGQARDDHRNYYDQDRGGWGGTGSGAGTWPSAPSVIGGGADRYDDRSRERDQGRERQRRRLY